MAQNDLGNIVGTIDKRQTTRAGSSSSSLSTPANYADTGAMKTRLAAINGAYYTAARLNQMTKNDMVLALRRADDAAGI